MTRQLARYIDMLLVASITSALNSTDCSPFSILFPLSYSSLLSSSSSSYLFRRCRHRTNPPARPLLPQDRNALHLVRRLGASLDIHVRVVHKLSYASTLEGHHSSLMGRYWSSSFVFFFLLFWLIMAYSIVRYR